MARIQPTSAVGKKMEKLFESENTTHSTACLKLGYNSMVRAFVRFTHPRFKRRSMKIFWLVLCCYSFRHRLFRIPPRMRSKGESTTPGVSTGRCDAREAIARRLKILESHGGFG